MIAGMLVPIFKCQLRNSRFIEFAQPFADMEGHAASVDRGYVQRRSDLNTGGRCIRFPHAIVV